MKTAIIMSIIIIIVIILIVIAPRSFRPITGSISDLTRAKMGPIEHGINAYYKNTGQYPNTLDDLIVCPPGYQNLWCGPYVKEKHLCDPWGNMYIYEPNSLNPDKYNLISYGADGSPEGEGDNKDIYND
jgi:general secretion pathway protein G